MSHLWKDNKTARLVQFYIPIFRFETLAWVSPFLYIPFYIAAIYAFLFEKEWIRIPGKGDLMLHVVYPFESQNVQQKHNCAVFLAI